VLRRALPTTTLTVFGVTSPAPPAVTSPIAHDDTL